MAYILRRARPDLDDARALLSAEQQSLGDSPYTPEEVLQVLQRPEHHAYLAFDEEDVAAFLSCLETPICDGPRLELDLLGVCPKHRGRGLATSLLRMAVAEAERRGTDRFRGVVAQDNGASQAAFLRAEFRATEHPVLLLVYEILGHVPVHFLPPGWTWLVGAIDTCAMAPSQGQPPEVYRLQDKCGALVSRAICQPVQTVAYKGLWIEELSAEPCALGVMLRAIVERAKALALDQVGRLASEHDVTSELDVWLRQGYRNRGRYLVFTMAER